MEILATLGFASLAFLLCKLGAQIWRICFPFLVAAPKNLKSLAGGAKWAVITGATDGIGKAYAFELAARGFDVLLISRSQSKLDTCVEELKLKHPQLETKTLVFDFSNPNLHDYEQKLLVELGKLEVGILVNNVGLSYEYPERLDRLDGGLKRIADVTIINTLPTTLLTAAILKQMVDRNGGVIVNVSSSASYHPMAYWAIYSATKQYVSWFSEILRKEYADTNIVIQTVSPMMVATKMSKVRKTSIFIPNAQNFAHSAVNSIGLVGETTGFLAHEFQANFYFGILPKFIIEKFINQNSLATRSRALKKKNAAAAKLD